MATSREATDGFLDMINGTFTPEKYCKHLASGNHVDVPAVIDAFDVVLIYRERIGIADQMISRQFDGFNAPQYKTDILLSPDDAAAQWARATVDTYIEDASYNLWSTGDDTLCTLTATLRPEDEYGLQNGGDISITGLLSADGLPDYIADI